MKKFTVKDLINAGLFSLLTLGAFYLSGMIGIVPVMMPLLPFVCALVSGPIFMLYSTRIDKFGMVLIMGILFSLVFSASGHGVYIMPSGIVISLIAEWILSRGNYRSAKWARLAYTVFSLFTFSLLLPVFIARDQYLQNLIDTGYGADYAAKFSQVLPSWSFPFIILLGCVGGYLGCTIGIKMLNKHFRKAHMI